MTDTWKGRALQRIRREIWRGSSGKISDDKLNSTRQNLVDNFHDKTENHWSAHERQVLRLSRLAGNLALIASWGKGHPDNDTPGTVEGSHVDGSLALVARLICRGVPGAYCTNYLDDEYKDEAEEVGGFLRYVVGPELKAEERQPADRGQAQGQGDEWDDWKTALNDTLQAIEDHAGLRLGDGLDVVRNKLEPSFRASSADEWNAFKDSVLRLAALAGALSSAATILDTSDSHWPPHKINDKHLFGSVAILARHLCPAASRPSIRGGYCQEFLASEYNQLAQSVKETLEPVMTLEQHP